MTTVTAPADDPVPTDGAPAADTTPAPRTRAWDSVLPIVFGIVMVVVIAAIVALVLAGTAFADPMAGT